MLVVCGVGNEPCFCFVCSLQGKEMLVPLSESLFAMGHLEEADKVLGMERLCAWFFLFAETSVCCAVVDIGTGFFVQKSIPDAQAYLSRKMVS